jgi:hypothetical protein
MAPLSSFRYSERAFVRADAVGDIFQDSLFFLIFNETVFLVESATGELALRLFDASLFRLEQEKRISFSLHRRTEDRHRRRLP